MRWLIAAAVACSLGGCGTRSLQPSALERYESLRTTVHRVTDSSGLVAADLARLGQHMAGASTAATRRDAVALQQDASSFEGRSGAAAAAIRALLIRDHNSVHRAYFRQIVTTLEYQWTEARRLLSLAMAVWWDPSALRPGASQRLRQRNTEVRRLAWMSVVSARRAELWRRKYRRWFTFVPVRPVQRAAAGPYT